MVSENGYHIVHLLALCNTYQFWPLSVVENPIIQNMMILFSVAHSASLSIVQRIKNCLHHGKLQFSKFTRAIPT